MLRRAMLRLLLLWICAVSMAQEINLIEKKIVNPNYELCSTSQCKVVEKAFEDHVKDFNDPCKDFASYACNGFSLPSDTKFSIFEDLLKADQPYLADKYYILDTNLYRQCLRRYHDKTDNVGLDRDVQSTLREFGADQLEEKLRTSASMSIHPNNYAWKEIDLKYASAGFGFAFFEVDVVERREVDPADGVFKPMRYIQVSPTRDSVLEIHTYLMSDFMDKAGCLTPSCESLRSFIDELNRELPKNQETEVMYNQPMRITDWVEKFRQGDPEYDTYWKDIFRIFFEKLNLKVPMIKYIIVKDEQYFLKLAQFLASKQTSDVIENYIHLRFRTKLDYIMKANFTTENPPVPRIKGVPCGTGFYIGAAYRYLDSYFPINSTDVLEIVYNDVTRRIESLLGGYAQIDGNTKTFIDNLRKANKVFGYPKWLADKNFAEDFYDGMEQPGGSYLQSQRTILRKAVQKKFKALVDMKHPVIDYRDLFDAYKFDHVDINRHATRIVIPMRAYARDTFKFFDYLLPPTMNFASAGTNIAYQIFSKWLNVNSQINKKVTDCIANQMRSNYQASDNSATEIEATAYALALRTAYESWRKYNSYPIQFIDFGAISELEGFFLTFAQSLCLSTPFRTGESPQMFINLAVSNDEEFSTAYACVNDKQTQDPMNRRIKCDPLDFRSTRGSTVDLQKSRNATNTHLTSDRQNNLT